MTLLEKFLYCWNPHSGLFGGIIFAALILTPAAIYKKGEHFQKVFFLLIAYVVIALIFCNFFKK